MAEISEETLEKLLTVSGSFTELPSERLLAAGKLYMEFMEPDDAKDMRDLLMRETRLMAAANAAMRKEPLVSILPYTMENVQKVAAVLRKRYQKKELDEKLAPAMDEIKAKIVDPETKRRKTANVP